MKQAEDDHIRSASAFLLASRGAWSLGIFLMANWLEISTFFRNQRLGKSIAAGSGTGGSRTPPPKEEQVSENAFGMQRVSFFLELTFPRTFWRHFSQEQVQLNVALQTEIVRFTVLGIQRAIRDVDETMAEQERLSGGGAGTSSFFVRPNSVLLPSTSLTGMPLSFPFLLESPHWRCVFLHDQRPRDQR
jgi:hypothetical protein